MNDRMPPGENAPRLTQSVTRARARRPGAAPNPRHPQVTPIRAMVLTCTVAVSETGLDRRRILRVAAVAGLGVPALAGCGLFGDEEPDPQPTIELLRPLLDEAVALAASYDRAVAAQPSLAAKLTPMAADHRAHASELARVIGSAVPSTSASGGTSETSVAALRTAEQAAQKTAVDVCKRAPASRAALTGSIAACRAAHAEALR